MITITKDLLEKQKIFKDKVRKAQENNFLIWLTSYFQQRES